MILVIGRFGKSSNRPPKQSPSGCNTSHTTSLNSTEMREQTHNTSQTSGKALRVDMLMLIQTFNVGSALD